MSSQFDANSNETLLSTSTSFLLDSSSFWLLFRIKLLILIPCVLAFRPQTDQKDKTELTTKSSQKGGLSLHPFFFENQDINVIFRTRYLKSKMNRRSLSAESLNPLQEPVTTNTNLSLKSKSYDRWAVICLIIAALNILHSLWVIIAPVHWYHNLPAGVPEFGPVNVHFIRDLGCVFLLLGVGLVFAAFKVPYRLPLFTMNTAFYILHMFVHIHEVVSGRIRLAIIFFILNIFMIKHHQNQGKIQFNRK
ncbi:unnamed protein product [Rotaria magnacalcarata]